jgi:hypothetical protein
MAKRNSGNQGGFGLESVEKKEPPELSNFRNKIAKMRRGCSWNFATTNTTTRQNRSDEKNNNNGRNSDRLEMTCSQWHNV